MKVMDCSYNSLESISGDSFKCAVTSQCHNVHALPPYFSWNNLYLFKQDIWLLSISAPPRLHLAHGKKQEASQIRTRPLQQGFPALLLRSEIIFRTRIYTGLPPCRNSRSNIVSCVPVLKLKGMWRSADVAQSLWTEGDFNSEIFEKNAPRKVTCAAAWWVIWLCLCFSPLRSKMLSSLFLIACTHTHTHTHFSLHCVLSLACVFTHNLFLTLPVFLQARWQCPSPTCELQWWGAPGGSTLCAPHIWPTSSW